VLGHPERSDRSAARAGPSRYDRGTAPARRTGFQRHHGRIGVLDVGDDRPAAWPRTAGSSRAVVIPSPEKPVMLYPTREYQSDRVSPTKRRDEARGAPGPILGGRLTLPFEKSPHICWSQFPDDRRGVDRHAPGTLFSGVITARQPLTSSDGSAALISSDGSPAVTSSSANRSTQPKRRPIREAAHCPG
jgi:hypothetical protein